MFLIDQIFKCEYSSSNFNIASFQYQEIYVPVLQHLSNETFRFFPVYAIRMLF